MARLDLHLHSTHSDGVHSPEWVVEQAAAHGAQLIALTDHDTLRGVETAQAAGRRLGVRVLGGVEVSVHEAGLGELHVLGFFPGGAPLAEVEAQLAVYRAERQTRAERTMARLAELGAPVEADVVAQFANSGAVGRPHVARALVAAGHVQSVQEAFDRFLHNDGPAYIPRTVLNLADSLALIHGAGGFSSIAHPTRYRDPAGSVHAFADAGGGGMEIYYRRDDAERIANGEQLAARCGLTPTVGSDFHGLHPDEVRPGGVASLPDYAADRLLAQFEDWT